MQRGEERVQGAPSLMFREAAEAGAVVRRQAEVLATPLDHLARRWRESSPRAVLTLARGSSDNAATYARYLIETYMGVLTSSAAPSVASVYGASPALADTLMLTVSQSGRSPDLIAAAGAARDGGACLVAVVNDESSPLATMADTLLPIAAGPERSVAATKSFIGAAAAMLALVARLAPASGLPEAIAGLPDMLEAAWALDWSPAIAPLVDATNLYVVARGHGYGIAQEVALKIKETCGFHAEAFSAAEVRHGPMALVERGFPVLLLGQSDETLGSVAGLAAEFAGRGALVISAGLPAGVPGLVLPALPAHPAIQPLLLAQSFYRLADALAAARGRDPDRPPHLAKVTETV